MKIYTEKEYRGIPISIYTHKNNYYALFPWNNLLLPEEPEIVADPEQALSRAYQEIDNLLGHARTSTTIEEMYEEPIIPEWEIHNISAKRRIARPATVAQSSTHIIAEDRGLFNWIGSHATALFRRSSTSMSITVHDPEEDEEDRDVSSATLIEDHEEEAENDFSPHAYDIDEEDEFSEHEFIDNDNEAVEAAGLPPVTEHASTVDETMDRISSTGNNEEAEEEAYSSYDNTNNEPAWVQMYTSIVQLDDEFENDTEAIPDISMTDIDDDEASSGSVAVTTSDDLLEELDNAVAEILSPSEAAAVCQSEDVVDDMQDETAVAGDDPDMAIDEPDNDAATDEDGEDDDGGDE